MGTLTDEAKALAGSVLPYDTRSMTYHKLVVLPSGRTVVREAPVARSYAEAMTSRKDYFHQGGPLFDGEGVQVGERGPGWFVGGYKWRSHPVDDTGWNAAEGTGSVTASEQDQIALAAVQR